VSHLTVSPIKILDLAALRSAAASFGAQFAEKKTFTSYTGSNNKCDYVIALPHVGYEVGVIRDKAGHYVLSHDPFGDDGCGRHDGHKLVAKFGVGLQKLQQAYAVQVVTRQAKAKGWLVNQRVMPNGSVKLQLIQA